MFSCSTKKFEEKLDRTDFIVQSMRIDLYKTAWKTLYVNGLIYPCKLSRRDVDSALSAPHGDSFHHKSDKKVSE